MTALEVELILAPRVLVRARGAQSHYQVVRTAASDSNAARSSTTRSLNSLSAVGRILRAVPASSLKPMVG